jgi:hypothetical protein
MRYAALAVCLLSVTACDIFSPTSPSPVNTEFTLAPGQSQSVAGTSLTFVGVTADSRCPANAICITAGDATVRVDLSRRGTSSSHELHTASKQPVSANDLTVELLEVAPYPFSFSPIDPAAYRVTLRVTR